MSATKNELLNYREKFANELHNNILAYWMKYGVEENSHGFYGAVDLDNKIGRAHVWTPVT